MISKGRLSMKKINPILLNSLPIFIEVARHLSFTKAAHNKFLTVSAVSQTIKRLEHHLECDLFQRHANRIHLTTAGKILLNYGQQAFNVLEKGMQEIAQQESILRIFSPPGVSSFLFNQHLFGLFSQHVSRIEMVADERPLIDNYTAWDLAVLFNSSIQPAKNLTYLGDDIYFPFCHPSLLEKLIDIKDIADFPLFCNQYGLATWEEWFTLNQLPLFPVKKIFYSRASQLISAIEAGEGIGFESLRVLSDKLKKGEFVLCRFPHLQPVIKRAMWLYINPDSSILHLIPDLREKLLDNFLISYDFINFNNFKTDHL